MNKKKKNMIFYLEVPFVSINNAYSYLANLLILVEQLEQVMDLFKPIINLL